MLMVATVLRGILVGFLKQVWLGKKPKLLIELRAAKVRLEIFKKNQDSECLSMQSGVHQDRA